LAAATLTGCAVNTRQADREHFAKAVEERSYAVRTNAAPAGFELPPGVELTDGVSEDEAVAVGLWNNPGFQEALTRLEFARADLVGAGLLANPTLSVLFPAGPKQLEFAVNLPLEAIWLRPRRVAFANLEAERIAQSLLQNGLDLIRDIRSAFADLQFAREHERLAQAAADLQSQIVKLTESRVKAGDISELEASAARLDLARLREDTKRARHDVRLADGRLRLITGIAGVDAANEFQSVRELPVESIAVETLERRAFASRPDLRASELAIESAGKRMGLAKAEVFTLTGILDANDTESGIDVGPGIQLPIPVFNRNQAGIARAKTELERASWNYLSVKDAIRHEVRESHSKFVEYMGELRSWRENVLPATEQSLEGFKKAFELGDVSLLAVHEQTRQLIAARARQAELAAAAHRARAELERNTGSRLQ